MPKIEGGYILLSKKIVNNEIMHKPPEYLKTWIYLLSNANFANDTPKKNLKKGHGFVNINELREFLAYNVGYRVEKPSRKKVWAIIEWLRNPHEGNNERDNEGTMIETTKVTHGMVYKVLNYATYQNPKNYERNNEGTTKETTNAQRKGQRGNNKYNEVNETNELNEEKRDKDIGGNVKSNVTHNVTETQEYKDFVLWFKKAFKNTKTKKVRDSKLPNIVKEHGIDQITRATERYIDECERHKRYLIIESTWWNGRYIDYLDDNYEEIKEPEGAQNINGRIVPRKSQPEDSDDNSPY